MPLKVAGRGSAIATVTLFPVPSHDLQCTTQIRFQHPLSFFHLHDKQVAGRVEGHAKRLVKPALRGQSSHGLAAPRYHNNLFAMRGQAGAAQKRRRIQRNSDERIVSGNAYKSI